MTHQMAAPKVAMVAGQEYRQFPDDLFIPPDALEVWLESFSGPLDLLLYLIKKQNIDILDIPIVSITQQYLTYIKIMQSKSLELAADYLLMAAVLAEIKSRMLLPKPQTCEEEEEDPRMALVRRLQAYEEIKEAARLLEALPRQDRDYFEIAANLDQIQFSKPQPEVTLEELLQAMMGLIQKEERLSHHQVTPEALSVKDRMNQILQQLENNEYLEFGQLFSLEEGRPGLVVSLLAILELARQFILSISQEGLFSVISIKAA